MTETKVYMIANLQIHDPKIYRKYEKGFFQILKKYNGQFITYDDDVFHVEGDERVKGRIILFSFPSKTKAEEWYADPEYQSISEYRRAGATTILTRVSGLPERE